MGQSKEEKKKKKISRNGQIHVLPQPDHCQKLIRQKHKMTKRVQNTQKNKIPNVDNIAMREKTSTTGRDKVNSPLCFPKLFISKKNPWQRVIGGGVCSDPWAGTRLAHTHTNAHTHTDGGARESRAENREKKYRAESMLDERIRPLAKLSAASFFPFSLQLSLFLFLFLARRLSSSPRSFPNHCLSLCQHA